MIKPKSQKVLRAICYVCRSYRGKTGRGPFCPPPVLNKVKGIGYHCIIHDISKSEGIFSNDYKIIFL